MQPDLVAARWLLIALTRAVHTLVITLRNPESLVARRLHEATDDSHMPKGIVE